jgi:hypothetical protein
MVGERRIPSAPSAGGFGVDHVAGVRVGPEGENSELDLNRLSHAMCMPLMLKSAGDAQVSRTAWGCPAMTGRADDLVRLP